MGPPRKNIVVKRKKMHIQLRPHQQEAYDSILESEDMRMIVKMFCGSGKSRVFHKIIVEGNDDLMIVIFPRIALVEQYKRDYIENTEWTMNGISPLYVCSETENSGSAFTTDEDSINTFLEQDGRKLICVTYQSLKTVIDCIEQYDMEIDLAIFDEAHHVIAPQTVKLLQDGPLSVAYRSLFFTATPPPEMDDYDMFGEIVYSYSFFEAVQDGICNPFEIIVQMTSKQVPKNIYEHTFEAYTKTQNGRILAFHSFAEATVEGRTSVIQYSGKKSKDECKKAFGKKSVRLEAVTAKTKDRETILKTFEETSEEDVMILHNCNILGEGIDTKSANMVVFADPKGSKVQIIQNIGRITRRNAQTLHPGTILLPVEIDVNQFTFAMTDEERHAIICEEMRNGGFQIIQNVIAALVQEDPDTTEMILRYPDRFAPSEVEETFKKAGYTKEKQAENLGELFDLPKEATESEVVEKVGGLEIHSQSMEEPIRVVGDGSVKVMETENGFYKMGGSKEKVSAPKRPFGIKYKASDNLGIMWNAKSVQDCMGACVIECTIAEDMWEERRQEWIVQYNKLGRTPNNNSKNLEVKRAGQWQSDQRKNYKKKETCMTPERIKTLEETPDWKWEEEDKWEPQRQNWIEQYNKLGRTPTNNSKNLEEKKSAKWQSNQRTN